MPKRFNLNDTGDSQELQSLFDSISGQPVARPAHVEIVGGTATAGCDSAELEALFDSVADQIEPAKPAAKSALKPAAKPAEKAAEKATVTAKVTAKPAAPAASSSASDSPADAASAHEEMFNRIGQMTRHLHDALRELGYDRALEHAAKAIPDARQRLNYIAEMTEQAASRVLNATDVAKPIQEALEAKSLALNTRWDRLYAGDLSVDEFKALAGDTKAFISDVPKQASATSAQLMEIMMAQDFQDLTGQVIKKIIDLAQSMETQLLQVLVQTMPNERKSEATDSLLNGPVIDVAHPEAVANQEQVDDLLESLGF